MAALLLAQSKDISHLIKTATDILRIVTYIAGGDVSLAPNTKFCSLPRKIRKQLVGELARVINEEDIGRHKNKWAKLFHNLHVGEYSDKVYAIAQKVRNNQPLASFYRSVEKSLTAGDVTKAIALLKQRPGEFGRRLDHL